MAHDVGLCLSDVSSDQEAVVLQKEAKSVDGGICFDLFSTEIYSGKLDHEPQNKRNV